LMESNSETEYLGPTDLDSLTVGADDAGRLEA
jgi:hypothetical protein